MNAPEPNEMSRLVARLSDGALSAEEAARLNELLHADPIAQEAYLDHLALDGWLECECGGELPQPAPAKQRGNDRASRAPSSGWFRWLLRPALAAALMVVGFAMGATAWAMTTRLFAKQTMVRLPLADAGFESGARPLAQGVPTKFDVWCGDFAELVSSQHGVAPSEGRQMLRFLRSDSEVEPSGATTYVGDMFQVVDLRPWRETLADGTAVAELSASFNCMPGEEMIFQTCLWAFTGDPAALPKNWGAQLRQELAFGSGTAHGDGDPQSWQRVTGRMLVPPEAELLVIELKVFPASRKATASPLIFTGVYADEVELTLRSDGHAPPARRRR